MADTAESSLPSAGIDHSAPAGEGRMSPERREALRTRLTAAIPSWYRPWAHLAFPSALGIGMIVTACCLIHDLHLWELAAVCGMFVISNAGEWRMHKGVLHKRTPLLEVLYDRHTPEHHNVFITEDMEMRSAREFRLVLIPAYGVFMLFLATLPLSIGIWMLGQKNLACLFTAESMFYIVTYEWLHLSYHLPRTSLVGRSRLIGRLRRHHATHHDPALMQRWNFNVTVPLWDFVRRTIYKPGEQPGDPPTR